MVNKLCTWTCSWLLVFTPWSSSHWSQILQTFSACWRIPKLCHGQLALLDAGLSEQVPLISRTIKSLESPISFFPFFFPSHLLISLTHWNLFFLVIPDQSSHSDADKVTQKGLNSCRVPLGSLPTVTSWYPLIFFLLPAPLTFLTSLKISTFFFLFTRQDLSLCVMTMVQGNFCFLRTWLDSQQGNILKIKLPLAFSLLWAVAYHKTSNV